MSVTIDQLKYTALLPLIQTLPGFAGSKVQNTYTLKFLFHSGFACLISKNTKNPSLAVHFENQEKDEANYLAIMNAIL